MLCAWPLNPGLKRNAISIFRSYAPRSHSKPIWRCPVATVTEARVHTMKCHPAVIKERIPLKGLHLQTHIFKKRAYLRR